MDIVLIAGMWLDASDWDDVLPELDDVTRLVAAQRSAAWGEIMTRLSRTTREVNAPPVAPYCASSS